MKKESKMGKERFSRFCDIVNEDVMREEVESSKLFIKAQESYHKNYVQPEIREEHRDSYQAPLADEPYIPENRME